MRSRNIPITTNTQNLQNVFHHLVIRTGPQKSFQDTPLIEVGLIVGANNKKKFKRTKHPCSTILFRSWVVIPNNKVGRYIAHGKYHRIFPKGPLN